MIVHVQLTQEDIDKGVKNNCKECPHARAIARALSDTDLKWNTLAVDYGSLYLYVGGSAVMQAMLPDEVSIWIGRFDGDLDVSGPMEYDLSIYTY